MPLLVAVPRARGVEKGEPNDFKGKRALALWFVAGEEEVGCGMLVDVEIFLAAFPGKDLKVSIDHVHWRSTNTPYVHAHPHPARVPCTGEDLAFLSLVPSFPRRSVLRKRYPSIQPSSLA
jgi:hypothetical protein